MHTIWKLYFYCFSAMSFPRHSLMMTANTYSGAYPFSIPGLQSAAKRAKISSF